MSTTPRCPKKSRLAARCSKGLLYLLLACAPVIVYAIWTDPVPDSAEVQAAQQRRQLAFEKRHPECMEVKTVEVAGPDGTVKLDEKRQFRSDCGKPAVSEKAVGILAKIALHLL